MKINKYIVILSLIFTSAFAKADVNKQELFESLVNKFSGINSISLKFSGDHTGQGQLKAIKGNKYILLVGERSIYCNSKVIWNYNKPENKVIISDFEPSTTLSIDEFFFNFTSSYEAGNLTKSTSTAQGTDYILELKPKQSAKAMKNIDFVKLYINPKNNEIHKVQLFDKGNITEFKISNIQINPKLNNSLFEFKIPKNAETVDLR